MEWKERIERIKLNSITISLDKNETKPLAKGSSKFGGQPDLPKDFKWYYFKGKAPSNPDIEDRPLSFLAQINCEEIKEYDIDKRLPSRGILYFFYELESMVWGFNHKDKGCAKVYYYDGDISRLERTDFPESMKKDYIMPEIKLSFSSNFNAPDYEELYDNYDFDLWEEYNDFLKKEGYSSGQNSTKLLGYSDNIQGDMLLECELVTNGINCGDVAGCNTKKRKELQKSKDQWKLLFQLDTVTTKDFQLMFRDCGRIYYYIKEEDLKNKNFNDIWLVLQSG